MQDGKKISILEDLKSRGAEIIEASPDDVQRLRQLLKGVDIVVSTLGGPSISQQFNLISAAACAGVKRFVPSEFFCDPEIALYVKRIILISVGKSLKFHTFDSKSTLE